jgi:spore coat protein H
VAFEHLLYINQNRPAERVDSIGEEPMQKKIIDIFPLLLGILIFACDEKSDKDLDAAENVVEKGAGNVAPNVDSFDPDHLIEVAIEMDSADWDKLRNEGRSLPDQIAYCGDPNFDFNFYESKVTIDGETLKNVGIRKKGYLGSLSVVRPSLKLDFEQFVEDQTYAGMKGMTLNNNRQDPSNTHQCMSYALFQKAGVAAPRCNFAHVTLNGQDLGIYTHVESIDKAFLARHFNNNDGNLYEVQRADFSEEAVQYIELKTNKKANDRSDLDTVVQALQTSDNGLYQSLDRVIDLDAFLTYWAMEVMVGQWDGATGDSNNHYLYHDPTTDKFYFIPWGMDGSFATGHVFLKLAGITIPNSVYAMALVPYKLYGNLETRRLYHTKLKELLDTVWDEDAILAEVDRINHLTSADPTMIEQMRTFVRDRRASIESELVGDGPNWPIPPELYPSMKKRECNPPSPIKGRFVTTWGKLSDYAANAQNSLTLSLDQQNVDMASVLSSAGPNKDTNATIGAPTIWVIGVPPDYPPADVVVITFNTASLFREGEVQFHGFETYAAVAQSNSESDYKTLGFVGGGKVVLEKAGTNPDAPVEGSFEGFFTRMY